MIVRSKTGSKAMIMEISNVLLQPEKFSGWNTKVHNQHQQLSIRKHLNITKRTVLTASCQQVYKCNFRRDPY